MLARAEMRTRLVSLLGLAATVAVVVAVVLAAVVGARRTSTTLDRFRDSSASSDAELQTNGLGQLPAMRAAVRGSPQVERSTTRYLVNGYPAGADESTPDFAIISDPSGHYGIDIDRVRLLDGRLPARHASDEIVLTEQAARLLHRGVGSSVHVKTFDAADLEKLSSGGGAFPGFHGPQLDLVVVGIGRTPDGLQGDVVRNSIYALAGPSFLAAHDGVGAWPPAVVARLRGGAQDVPALRRHIVAALGPEVGAGITTATDEYLATTQRTIDGLATGLLVFAVVAGAAGLAVVGQMANRQVAAGSDTGSALRTFGLGRAGRAAALALPALLAAVVGIAVAVPAAVALSPLLPTGLARRAEIDPGPWVDPGALVVGALVALVLAAIGTVAAAWRGQRIEAQPVRRRWRPSSSARVLAGWGAPPATVTGVRYAFEAGDRPAVPVRAALLTVSIAVAGVLGAGVVAGSLDALVHDGGRWGWNWSTMPDAFDGPDPTPQLVKERAIDAVGTVETTSIRLGPLQMSGFAMEPLKGSPNFTLASGRLPTGPSEVALGQQTLHDLGVSIGETVPARAPDRTAKVEMEVVGTVVLPPTQYPSPGVGAVLTPAGLAAVAIEEPERSVVLRYRSGTDAASLERRLTTSYGLAFPVFAQPQAPGSVKNIVQGRGVAVALACFFAALGIAGLFHALVVSSRRRRRDFAVLRALGFRRAQVRRTVMTQAVTIAVVGLVVGIPLGIAVGRFVWARLVGGLGVIDDPSTPWGVLVAVAPLTVAVAVLVAWSPGRHAAAGRPSESLRAD